MSAENEPNGLFKQIKKRLSLSEEEENNSEVAAFLITCASVGPFGVFSNPFRRFSRPHVELPEIEQQELQPTPEQSVPEQQTP